MQLTDCIYCILQHHKKFNVANVFVTKDWEKVFLHVFFGRKWSMTSAAITELREPNAKCFVTFTKRLSKVWKNLRSITFSSLRSTLRIILHQQQEHNVSWSYKCMTAVKHTHLFKAVRSPPTANQSEPFGTCRVGFKAVNTSGLTSAALGDQGVWCHWSLLLGDPMLLNTLPSTWEKRLCSVTWTLCSQVKPWCVCRVHLLKTTKSLILL